MNTIWTLRTGADRRFRTGHPWVYSNELLQSPKGLAPGAPVELRDPGGKFLARGYGNPASLIAFRTLSRDITEVEPTSKPALRRSLERAYALRKRLGLADVSHRLVFGEADDLPGVIVDRYLSADGNHQAYIIQAHTAGADTLIDGLIDGLQDLQPASKTSIVVRKDIGVRRLEGVGEGGIEVFGEKKLPQSVRIGSASGGEPVIFNVDLAEGQKTGFFLDQAANVKLALSVLGPYFEAGEKRELRILDICSYVGQWSVQLAAGLKKLGIASHVTAFDSSESALKLARENVRAAGAFCEVIQGDALRDLEKLAASGYDLVVCDPPALIKGRKDIPQGKHAYLQLNTQALRVLKPGGAIVSCSCSGLLPEEDFLGSLAKAATRNQARVQWLARGAQAPDHPMRPEFSEGRYLKCWIGVRPE